MNAMDERRSLNDDLFDAALREALRQRVREEEREAAELLDRFQAEAEAAAPSKKFISNMKYLSSRAGKRKAPAKIYSRSVRMAAMFALVAALGIVGTLGVEAYRNGLFGWVLRQNKVYTSLELEDSIVRDCSSSIFADTEWEYYYFPKNIPVDFQLESVEVYTTICDITLTHDEQEISLSLNEIAENMYFSAYYDTEGTEGFQRVMLGDYECYYVKKTYPNNLRIIQVICTNGDFWIHFTFRNVPQKEAFKIVESMQKIYRE